MGISGRVSGAHSATSSLVEDVAELVLEGVHDALNPRWLVGCGAGGVGG